MDRRNFIKRLAPVAAGALATGGLGLTTLGAEAKTGPVKRHSRRESRFANATLITHEGREVKFYDDCLKDKIVLINFMFTSCSQSCPAATYNLSKVQEQLGDRLGRDIFMYSISLDNVRDTPEQLKAYAEHFHARPGWSFLTGSRVDVEAVRRSIGFVYSDPSVDGDRTQHVGMVKYGVEPLERWASCSALTRPKWIAQYLYWLEPKGARPDRSLKTAAV